MSDDSPLVFAVDAKHSIHVKPPERPVFQSAPVRSRISKAQEEYDAKRRPQAAKLYRLLRDCAEKGSSWRECWALGEGNEGWDVGPIVIWLRSRSVDIEAVYDPVRGETRFYLRLAQARSGR
jgi:hypothetical protein